MLSKTVREIFDLAEFNYLNTSKTIIKSIDLADFVLWKNLLAEKRKGKF